MLKENYFNWYCEGDFEGWNIDTIRNRYVAEVNEGMYHLCLAKDYPDSESVITENICNIEDDEYKSKIEDAILEHEINELFENQTTITLTSAEVKENDFETYDYIKDMLQRFVDDEVNLANEEDLEQYENGEYLIEYFFDKDILKYTAGRSRQELNNQNTWMTDKKKIYY